MKFNILTLKRAVDDLSSVLTDLNPEPIYLQQPRIADVYIPNLRSSDELKSEKDQESYKKPKPTVNSECRLCPDRIYPVRRYLVEGKTPILVLHHNYPIDEKSKPLPDRSDKQYFATVEEDLLFNRMLKSVQINSNDLFYQEFVACHFDQRSLAEDWNRRTNNCLVHLRNTIENHKIRFLIVTGTSALLLFGDRAKAMAERSDIVDFKFNDRNSIQAMVIRSPASILFMESQRLKLEYSLKDFPDHLKSYDSLKTKPTEFRSYLEKVLENSAIQKSENKVKRIIGNVKLTSASSIEKQKTESDQLREAGYEADSILWRLMQLRDNEIKIKKQIIESLNRMKAQLG